MEVEIESVKCECCEFTEDYTQGYISQVKSNFDNKWLCGLCCEAVRYEMSDHNMTTIEEAIKAHMSVCAKFRNKINNRADLVFNIRKILRRMSSDLKTSSTAKKFGRSNTT